MHSAGEARYRSERRGEVKVRGAEVTRGGDLTRRAPIDPAAATDRAVDERAPVEVQCAAFEAPAARRIAEEDRNGSDGRARPVDLADAGEIASQPRGVEHDRRSGLAEAHAEAVHGELRADDLAARSCKMQRRAAEASVQNRATEPRAGKHGDVRLLRDHRRSDRADGQPRRTELERAHLERIPADHRASCAEGKTSAAPDTSLEGQP